MGNHYRKKHPKSSVINFMCTADFKAAVHKRADELEISVSDFIRDAILDALKEGVQ